MTIKESIIQKYEELGDWEFSGKVARDLSFILQKKESNVERRMRELEVSGYLERRLVQVEGVPNKVVQYRVIKQEELPTKIVEKAKEIVSVVREQQFEF